MRSLSRRQLLRGAGAIIATAGVNRILRRAPLRTSQAQLWRKIDPGLYHKPLGLVFLDEMHSEVVKKSRLKGTGPLAFRYVTGPVPLALRMSHSLSAAPQTTLRVHLRSKCSFGDGSTDAINSALRSAIRRDYANNTLLQVDGWLIPETAVYLSALAALELA